MATGFSANGWSSPRLSQSSAFFSPPGTEKLYSGVAISTPSAWRMRSRSAATAAGKPCAKTSPSKTGTSRQSTMSSVIVGGIDAPASRSAMRLSDAVRKLPHRPTMSRVLMDGLGL